LELRESIDKILLIESNIKYAEKIKHSVQDLCLEIDISHIQSLGRLRKELAEDKVGLIICNYSLSDFTWRDVFSISQEIYPEMPFLLVAGDIDEEEATDIMIEGVSDVVSKNNLRRLSPVIERELNNYHKRQEADKCRSNIEERVKEQACLYKVTSLNEKELTIGELLSKAVALIPEGFQYPNITEAEIIFDNKVYQTDHFKETDWMLSSEANVIDKGEISVRVFYIDEKEDAHEGPFLYEERRLIDAIIDSLAQKIDHIYVNNELQKNQDLLNEAYNVAQIGHWELDLDKNKLYWSNRVKELHEVPLDCEPDLDKAIEFYHKEDRSKIEKLVNKAINTGAAYKADLKIITAKGNKRWIRSTGNPKFEDGKCVRLFGTTQNITEQKRAEEKLRKSEERYKSLYEDNHASMLLIDPISKKVVDANSSALEFYGYSREEITGMAISNINEEDPELLSKRLKEIRHEKQKRFEFQHELADGAIRDVIVYAGPIKVDDKDLIYEIVFDDTDRKQAEHGLRKLSKATEQSPALILITDTEGNIEYVNPKFAEVSEYSQDELIGKNPRILKSGKQSKEFYKEFWDAITSGKDFKSEFTNKKKSGEYYQVLQHVAPIYNENNEVTHYISVQEDITERKKNELKIQQSLEEKEVLLGEIHHRVKNNLQVVSGIMQLQAMDEENEKIQEKLFDSVSRIQSIGTVHNLLYRSESFSEIAFNEAIREVATNAIQKYENSVNVNIEYDVESIDLNINQALPTALVINEVISNIFKCEIDDENSVNIVINARQQKTKIELIIKYDGIKLPYNFDDHINNKSLGIKLIKTLVTQLDGTYSYQPSKKNTSFHLAFEKANVKGVGNAEL